MALSNFENITVAQCLAQVKPELSQSYFQPGLDLAYFNFGPGFRVWQRAYDSMIIDLMSKAVTADVGALSLLTNNLGRAYIRNGGGVNAIFQVDGLTRTLAPNAVWNLTQSVIDLIKTQATRLGYTITDTSDADYAANGVVDTFGD